MRILEIRERRRSLCGILFDEEINPALWGADSDAAGWLTLDSELCTLEHLKVGTELNCEELTSLIEKSHIKRAKSRAMWYLSQSDHAKAALIKKLSSAFPDYAAEAAAERMEELGLLNDTAYANRRIQRLLDEKSVSLKLAVHLLEAEGIDRETASLAAENAEYDALLMLTNILERKYIGKINSKKDVDRMMSALLRKGFSYSEIREALRENEIDTSFNED